MKGIYLLLSILLIVGCQVNTSEDIQEGNDNSSNLSSYGSKKKVKGNGDVTTKNISTSDYDAIKVSGSMEVHLVEGKEGELSITGESNVIPHIVTEVKNNQLRIYTENNISLNYNENLIVKVPVESINAVTLNGSGEVIGKHELTGKEMEVKLSGSGDIVLSLDATNVQSSVTGSGDITIKGNTETLSTSVTGSGDFHGEKLESKSTNVKVTGSGDASVRASESIDALVTGSGDIEYSGSPANKKTKVTGSGDITAR